MSRRARRYDDYSKLNVKKVIAVIVFALVIVMFFIGIKFLLSNNSKSTSGKVETLNYYTAYDNGKWGVINSYGEMIVEPQYDEMIVIPDNSKDIFICTYDANYTENTYKTKAINSKGKEIIQGYDKVEAIQNFDEKQKIWYETNLLRVQKNSKYGLVDFSGKELLSAEYDKIEQVHGIKNSLLITKDDSVGLCDDSGNIIIEPKYKEIQKIENDYKNGYIVIDKDNKYGIIGFDKSIILDCKYDEIKGVYSKDLFVVKKNNKYVVIDKDDQTIIENKFDEVEDISGEYIVAKKNGKFGIINKAGETKVEFEYDKISIINSELCIAQKNDMYGIIDVNGEEKLGFNCIGISYIKTGDFIIADYLENNELVSKVINSNFEEKITGVVLEVNETKGYIKVQTKDSYKYYNFKFEEIESSSVLTSNTLFLSKKDGRYGFVDKDGKVVVDYIYDDATEQNSSGYAGVKQNGLWGSIDAKGNVVLNPQYNLDNNTKIDFIGEWHICEDANANYYLDV